MRFLIFLAVFIGISASVDSLFAGEWASFKKQFKKIYSDVEKEAERFKVFIENLKLIKEHNRLAKQGVHDFTLAINEFADLTFEEFSRSYLGYKAELKKPAPLVHSSNSTAFNPISIDWRDKGVVSPVKNQGNCGSCWAFSAVASLEGRNALKTGNLVELSEQNLMDCSKSYGDESCEGGLMDNAFKYIVENGGVDTEASYPYEGRDESCHFNPSAIGATMRNYTDIPANDEESLANAVAQGPVSVAIQATFWLQFYHKGVFKDHFCFHPARLNHGVTVVGYGTDQNKDFWIIKNSWGKRWGEHGYVRYARGRNQCGIASAASYPVV